MKNRTTSLLAFALVGLVACGGGREDRTPDPGSADRPEKTAEQENHNIRLILATAEDEAKYGPWPWKRSMHGKIIDFLSEAGAKVILVDIVFSERADQESDNALADAIRKSASPVYLGAILDDSGGNDLPDDVRKQALNIEVHGKLGTKPTPVLWPHHQLRAAGGRPALLSIFPERDGTLESIPLVLFSGQHAYPSLPLVGALELSGHADEIELWPKKRIKIGSVELDVEQFASIRPDWAEPGQFPISSYGEILTGAAAREDFENAAVFVGYNGTSFDNKHITPVHNAYLGTEIQALTMRSILVDLNQ